MVNNSLDITHGPTDTRDTSRGLIRRNAQTYNDVNEEVHVKLINLESM